MVTQNVTGYTGGLTKFQKIGQWVDRSIRPLSYLAFGAALVAEVWLLFQAPDAVQNKYLLSVTILLSAVMATCGWMWSGHISRRLARKNQATTILLALRDSEINNWKHKVYDYIKQLENEEDAALPIDEAALPIDEIEKLLRFYEFLSIAVMNGTADEDMIKESQTFVFLRLYQGLKSHIEKRRSVEPGLYCHFVHYTKKWNESAPRFRPSYVKTDRDFL